MSSEASRAFILASSSPRRRELLSEACFAPTVLAPEVDESAWVGERPEALAERLALAKARAVAPRVPGAACVLAADTLVVLGDSILGKPGDFDEAVAMLLRLAGRTHRVLTGFALVARGDPPQTTLHERSGVEESLVTLRAVSLEEARSYAASGEPLDKAGGYAAQGRGGRFVESIVGSRSNVIGLPLERVLPLLEEFGVRRSCPSC